MILLYGLSTAIASECSLLVTMAARAEVSGDIAGAAAAREAAPNCFRVQQRPDDTCDDVALLRAARLDLFLHRAALLDCVQPSPAIARVPTRAASRLWSARHAVETSPYGLRMHPIARRMKFHHGLDLDADDGDLVVPLAAGVVTVAAWDDGYGWLVEVEHPSGLRTRYAHNRLLLVEVGDRVRGDTPVAEAGSEGVSTGSHVHLEVRDGDRTVDPRPYVDSPERLLR